MSKLKLDLNLFKHKESDDHSTTLEHKDGHIFKIAHNSLSQAGSSALKALAGASKKSNDSQESEEDKKKKKAPYGKIMDPKGNKPQVFAEGGSVQDWIDKTVDKYLPPEPKTAEQRIKASTPPPAPKESVVRKYGFAEGGDVEQDPIQSKDPEINPLDKALTPDFSQDALNEMKYQGNKYDPSGKINFPEEAGINTFELPEPTPTVGEDKQAKENYQEFDPKGAEQDALKQQAAESQLPEGQVLEPASQQPEQGLAPDTNVAPTTASTQAPESMGSKGIQSQIAAQNLQANALSEQGKAEARALDEQKAASMEASAAYKKAAAEITETGRQYEQDVKNGYVDPNKYWTGYTSPNGQKVEGHSKLMATIGMIIAGFGGNNGVKMLDDQINQSLEAQKQNLQSSHNLLRANMDKYKNLQDAYSATRLQLNDDVMNRLKHAEATAKSPLAKAAAMSAIGQLQQKQNEEAQKLSLTRALSNVNPSTPEGSKAVGMVLDQMALRDPERAKEYKERFVPGVGFAGTSEGAKGLREMKTTTDTVRQGIQRLREISKKTGKSLSLTDRAEVDSIKQSLVGRLREPITGPGAMSEGERAILQNLIPAVADTFTLDSVNAKKLDTLEKTVQAGYNNMLRANGLAPSQQSIGASSMEGKTATGPNGQKIIFQSGKWHPVK